MAPSKAKVKKVKQKKKYSKEMLNRAMEEINSGMSAYQASKKYGIPKSTLKDKKNQKYANQNCGRQPVLGPDEEKLIIKWTSWEMPVFLVPVTNY